MSKENKIKVIDFVNKYKGFKSENAKAEYLKGFVKTDHYVPYMTKVFYAKEIVKVATLGNTSKEAENNVTVRIQMNSCKRFLLYILTLIDLYTMIDMDSTNMTTEYDLLESNGLVEKILELIPQKEQDTFSTILNMCQEDFMFNEFEIHNYIRKNIIPELEGILSPLVQSLVKNIESFDTNKLINFVNSLKE